MELSPRPRQQASCNGAEERRAQPEDLVHLYNTLLRYHEELAESGPEVLRGADSAEGMEESIQVERALGAGTRSKLREPLPSLQGTSAPGADIEAAVLYARAAEHAERVHGRASDSSSIVAAADKCAA